MDGAGAPEFFERLSNKRLGELVGTEISIARVNKADEFFFMALSEVKMVWAKVSAVLRDTRVFHGGDF
jgi:hypothetical protein